jgi:hypothetical protein
VTESIILWILGGQTTLLLALISVVAASIKSHTDSCQEWQERFLVEHGKLLASQELTLRRLEQLEKR